MKIYKIGKAPLSMALGFGEITIPRYLEGQVPSKEYSDVVRAGLASPAYMKQKLLYFIQGIYSALYGRPIFTEDCSFALLEGTADVLTDDEKKVIDLVVNTFGIYGGKVLERITHNEDPWKEARMGYGDGIPSSELLPKEHIMKYYIAVNQKYGIETQNGLMNYIHDILKEAS